MEYGSLSKVATAQHGLKADRFAGEIENSINGSKRYSLADIRRSPIDIGLGDAIDGSAFIQVTTQDIRYQLVVLHRLAGLRGRIGVLNPGSYFTPGGRYLNGGYGPEEKLCGNSTLCNVLEGNPEYYRWNSGHINSGRYTNVCLYTPNIIITDNECKCIGKVDVITCSPPERNIISKSMCNKAIHDRVELAFNVAARNGVKNFYLCDFGVKGSNCDVEFIAETFSEYCTLYSTMFDYITIVLDSNEYEEVFNEIVGG